jgi:hypothetical protein
MATTSYEVYFARHKSAGRSGLIKIGYAANSEKRMKALECDLLVAIPGGRNVEAFLHEKFRRDRKFGEWFAPSPELMDFIARVKAGDDPLDGVVVPAASPSKVREAERRRTEAQVQERKRLRDVAKGTTEMRCR